MKKAIKTLESRIAILNQAIKESEMVLAEPEMLSDLDFAQNDIANYELEIMEHQKAIEILNKQL